MESAIVVVVDVMVDSVCMVILDVTLAARALFVPVVVWVLRGVVECCDKSRKVTANVVGITQLFETERQ